MYFLAAKINLISINQTNCNFAEFLNLNELC
jgi:hypothetical protein